eukprot:4645275-Pyramimonas_sp.AAC.1
MHGTRNSRYARQAHIAGIASVVLPPRGRAPRPREELPKASKETPGTENLNETYRVINTPSTSGEFMVFGEREGETTTFGNKWGTVHTDDAFPE